MTNEIQNSLLGTEKWVTDGGLETDLLFNRGVDLPEFASFPLLEHDTGRGLLRNYYGEYAEIAAAAAAGVILETPTWRSNPDWGKALGYDVAALDSVNQRAVDLVRSFVATSEVANSLISGVVGPRGDGYIAAGADPDEAADYHSAQVQSFATAGADFVHAMTLSESAEAIGVVRAARAAAVPVAISFTVETDGRLPDGTPLQEAIELVDATAAPDWYGVNCAHPTHLLPALEEGATNDAWRSRVVALRPNASTLTHAELDEMTVLDTGDLSLLTDSASSLRELLPSIRIVGGCCGTDSQHVAALWHVPAPPRA